MTPELFESLSPAMWFVSGMIWGIITSQGRDLFR